jgi:hypothetical protein
VTSTNAHGDTFVRNNKTLRVCGSELMVRLPQALRGLAASLLLLLLPAPAHAAVEISFFSHEFGANFPHAFVVLAGVDDRSGQRIDANYGFTATHISPAILFGSVKGEVFSRDSKTDAQYLASSDRHFSFQLSDAEYDAVMATVERWRSLKQPSYDLNRSNCVHFVADVAARLGMSVATPKPLMKKPRSFIESVTAANLQWLAERNASIHRQPPSASRRTKRRSA